MRGNNSSREVFNYKLDKILTRGTPMLVLLLSVFSFFIVILIGLLAFVINSRWSNGSSFYSIWKTIMYLLDAGNLADENSSLINIFLMSIVTVFGIFVTSTLIGIINNGIQDRIMKFRTGNSKIIEEKHTIILGFNEGVFSLLSELIKANENKKNAVIVILGSPEKPEMEDIINNRIPNKKTTTIICHSGSTSDIMSLEKCSVNTCKSIIVNEENDFNTIKCIMAVVSILEKSSLPNNPYMTVVIKEQRNLSVAKLASKGFAEVLYFNDVISRIIAQTSYQSGLSKVFIELFDFDGDEIYIEKFPELVGKKFSEILVYFEKSTVIGIKNGVCKLNPPMDTIIKPGDYIILIAEDDNCSHPIAKQYDLDYSKFKNIEDIHYEKVREKILVLENNSLLKGVVKELDNYLAPESIMTIAHSRPSQTNDKLNEGLSNLSIDYLETDIYNPDILKELVLDDYSNILVMSISDEDYETADAKTLMLLMHLRSLIEQYKLDITVTSEMKDARSQKLASSTQVSDFVVSSNIISLMVSQISENRDLICVFGDLLDSDGSEIYIRPALMYLHDGVSVSIGELTEFFTRMNQIFIGFKQTKDEKGSKKINIVTNPSKDEILVIDSSMMFILISEN